MCSKHHMVTTLGRTPRSASANAWDETSIPLDPQAPNPLKRQSTHCHTLTYKWVNWGSGVRQCSAACWRESQLSAACYYSSGDWCVVTQQWLCNKPHVGTWDTEGHDWPYWTWYYVISMPTIVYIHFKFYLCMSNKLQITPSPPKPKKSCLKINEA